MGLTDIFYAGKIKEENEEIWNNWLTSKEYLYSKIEEIEKIIKLTYDKVVSIEKQVFAEQYRQGLKL